MEEGRRVTKGSRYDKVCWPLRLFHLWVIPLFNLGWKRTVTMEDLYDCTPDDDPSILGQRLEQEWDREVRLFKSGKIKRPNAFHAVWRTFGWQWILIIQPTIWLEMTVRLTQPFMIERIVRYLSQDEGLVHPDDLVTQSDAQKFAAALIVMTIFFSLFRHYAFLLCFNLGMRVRAALTVLLFKKILLVSKSSNKQTDAGQVLNVLANDLYRFDEVTKSFFGVIAGPIMAVIVLTVTYYNIGLSFLGGLIILLTFIPFQAIMGRLFTRFRRKTTRITDSRVRLMSEILSAMKLIKVYCWESPFARLVDDIRTKEIHSIRNSFTLKGINAAVSYVCTKMMLFASLLIYSLSGNRLIPPLVFVTMSLYSSLNIPMLKNFSQAVGSAAEVVVATQRVTDILMLDEKPEQKKEELKVVQYDGHKRKTVEFKNFSGKWSKSIPHNNLSNISLSLESGELLMVIGSVGSGKTCFLWSLLREIEQVSGSCVINGSTSYAPQESWCFGGTVRQNILVSRPFDQDRYETVLKICCLDRDVSRFADKDESFVGEKGYTLSGGQKARVTLARAVYSHADVYLLDDPLSAVDPKVASLIFDRCIKSFLTGKTVVLVTHQLQFLPKADKILMLKEGEVCAFGTYDQLKNESQEFVSFLNQKEEEKRKDSLSRQKSVSIRTKSLTQSVDSDYEAEAEETPNTGPAVDRKEVQSSGSMPVRLFWEYLTAGRQIWLLVLTIGISGTSQALFHFSDLWLAAWTEKGDKMINGTRAKSTVSENLIHEDESYNVTIYCVLMGSLFVGAFLRSTLTFKLCMNCSICLHDRVFRRVLRAPMSFFENTPLGRIMNRFTKDVGVVDQDVPFNIVEMNMTVVQVFGVIVMTVVVNHWLVIPCLVLFCLAVGLRNYYIRTARDLQRLDSMARSPVYAQVSTTFDGLITIRAFGLEQEFERQFIRFMQDSVACRFLVLVAGRLVGLLIDSLISLYIMIVVLLCVLMPKGTIAAGDAGALLSSAIILTGICQYALKLTTEFETQMISVERVFEYGRLEQESEGTEHSPLNRQDSFSPAKQWPTKGDVVFEHVFLRYSPEQPFVLKDTSFTIKGGEKVGVVGRTGAGKSSLISVLFRLVHHEGRISIDGLDTNSLGLRDLRSAISIIPQDPSLFSGTVRKNLDPFDEKPDSQVWQALEDANLGPAIRALDGGLDARVWESGSNFSVGQRQLLCLARALLSHNKILVLDEATANVDQETDSQIQKALRLQFADCTVLTIAHRLNTVMHMDAILVLDEGRVLEYDHPFLLLQKPGGLFHSMVRETDHAFADSLRAMARDSYLDRSHRIGKVDMRAD